MTSQVAPKKHVNHTSLTVTKGQAEEIDHALMIHYKTTGERLSRTRLMRKLVNDYVANHEAL